MYVPYTFGQTLTGSPLTINDDERRRHIYISGKTGTGKSTLLLNLMLSDLQNNRPFALLDPHGDLATTIADAVPPRLTPNVIYLDPQDPTHVVGLNPLQNVPVDQRSKVAAHIVASFRHLSNDSWGPRLEYILTNIVRLLLDNNTTLLAIPLLLVNDRYRSKLLEKSTDPFVTAFWQQEYEKYTDRLRAEAISPIQNKVGQFTGNSILRSIIGQPSTIKIPHILNNGKYLIANLSKSMGEAPAHMLGAFLTTAFAQAVEQRAAVPEHERRDFTLYVDEFQNFATSSFSSILSEARKWRLNLVLANQFLSQVSDDLRRAILGNVGSLMVLRVGAEDAELLAKELGHDNATTLTDTPNFHAWARLTRGGSPSSPIPIITLPADPPTGSLPAVRARTHARHARPRAHVERRIARFIKNT
jgi:hypothetical protein